MKREILSLTGLRGIAAIIVVFYHFGQPSVDVGMASRFYIPRGYIAVDCFFMLSGFVLSYNYAARFLQGRSVALYGDFLMRRVARIYPAFIGVTALYLFKLMIDFSSHRAIDAFGWKDAIANVFMATGWGLGIRAVIGDSWSVSAELVCYIAFPLLTWLVFGRRFASAAVALILAVAGYVLIARSGIGAKGWLDAISPDSTLPLLRALLGFLLGMVLYEIYATFPRLEVASSIMTAGAFIGIILSITGLDSETLLLASIFVLVLALSFDGLLARLLFANPLAMFLGRISYSLYLIHVMFVSSAFRVALKIQVLIGATPAYWVALVIYGCVVVALATLSYEIFEVRGKRVIMAASGRQRRQARTAVTQAR